MPLVPQDVRGVSIGSMSEAQRVREEGAAAQTSDAEAKPVQVDLLLQLQQMMAEQARRQEEQARRQEEQARRQEEQARCQAEQLRELKEEQARRQEEQARRQEEQARRQEEQARCQAEQLREQAHCQAEQLRELKEMHKDFTKGLQKAVERVQEVEEGLGKLEHRVMAIEERVEEEISKIKQEMTSPSPLKSRSRLAAVFDAPNAASSATKGLKIPHYDGTTSWTAFKLQFETLMEAYGWTQKEAQSALTLALRDQALSVLEAIGASGDLSFSALLDALEARFGDSHLEHVYRAQLKERTQRANESLQQWSVEIEKLVRRAFRSTPSMIEGTLLQAFIDGIRDPEVRAAVHLGHHKNMKEALAHALEVEAVRGNPRTLGLREMTTTEQVPPRRRNFVCYGCGERGHIRSDCPKKMNRQDAAVSTSDQQGNLNPAKAAGWALAGSGTTPTIYIKQTNDGNTLVIDGQVHQDDKMPPLICELCVDKVNDFYEFLEMCRQTNKRTRLRLGLPPQSMPRGAPDAGECILGLTEPVYVNDDSDGEPLSKQKKQPKVKGKREPELKVKLEQHPLTDRKARYTRRSPTPPRVTRQRQNSKEDSGSLNRGKDTKTKSPKVTPKSILKRESQLGVVMLTQESHWRWHGHWTARFPIIWLSWAVLVYVSFISDRKRKSDEKGDSVLPDETQPLRVRSQPFGDKDFGVGIGRSKNSAPSNLTHKAKHNAVVDSRRFSEEDSLLTPRLKRSRDREPVKLETPVKKVKIAIKPASPPKIIPKSSPKLPKSAKSSSKTVPKRSVSPPRLYKCTVCGQNSKSPQANSNHQRSHTVGFTNPKLWAEVAVPHCAYPATSAEHQPYRSPSVVVYWLFEARAERYAPYARAWF
ncbi:unnamed protein product [Spodoptera exigua]|nr:unnamed protein product [Spodoptera exigua]